MAANLLGRDSGGAVTYALYPVSYNNNFTGTLATGVEQHVTVPSDYKKYEATFYQESGSDIWVAINQTAIAPTGALAFSWSEHNPVRRIVKPGDVISFITKDTLADFGVRFDAIQ